MIFSNTKTLDLHGETGDIARILVTEFIEDCYKMGEEKAVIIHGISGGVLRKVVQKTLSQNKKVEKFYLDFLNPGQTIIEMRPNV